MAKVLLRLYIKSIVIGIDKHPYLLILTNNGEPALIEVFPVVAFVVVHVLDQYRNHVGFGPKGDFEFCHLHLFVATQLLRRVPIDDLIVVRWLKHHFHAVERHTAPRLQSQFEFRIGIASDTCWRHMYFIHGLEA